MARQPIGETNRVLAQIINVIYDHGPISSAGVSGIVGRSREYVDVYLRQGRDLKMLHVDALASVDERHNVKLFVFGPGVDSAKSAHKPVVSAPVANPKKVYVPRHDDAMLAFFGRAA